MVDFFGMFTGSGDDKHRDNDIHKDRDHRDSREVEEKKVRLRKEELDVAKNKVDIGKVEVGKEIIEEQKIINVPVTHEEVIIERRQINEPSDRPIEDCDDEHFSLSVSEERVEVGKHTVVTGEVSAHKKEVQENKEIKETIKREEARINKDGDANIVEDIDHLH
jgi:uncharacterized protein (TIGR02271 family)